MTVNITGNPFNDPYDLPPGMGEDPPIPIDTGNGDDLPQFPDVNDLLSGGPGPYVNFTSCSKSCGGGRSRGVLEYCDGGQECTIKEISCNTFSCQGVYNCSQCQ